MILGGDDSLGLGEGVLAHVRHRNLVVVAIKAGRVRFPQAHAAGGQDGDVILAEAEPMKARSRDGGLRRRSGRALRQAHRSDCQGGQACNTQTARVLVRSSSLAG